MNKPFRSLAATLLAAGIALPAAAASDEEIAKGILAKAVFTVAVPAVAVAAPGLFVGVMVVGTGLMVKTIATGMQRHRGPGFERQPEPQPDAQAATPFPRSGWYRPVAPQYVQAPVDASVFPVSTGMYGAVIPAR